MYIDLVPSFLNNDDLRSLKHLLCRVDVQTPDKVLGMGQNIKILGAGKISAERFTVYCYS